MREITQRSPFASLVARVTVRATGAEARLSRALTDVAGALTPHVPPDHAACCSCMPNRDMGQLASGERRR